jgi:hypothetical protein
MAYNTIDLPGPSVSVGGRLVTPVARRTEIGFSAGQVGAGLQYVRPVRVDLEAADGTQTSLPIVDHTSLLRLLVIAAVVAAFIIGRMRS